MFIGNVPFFGKRNEAWGGELQRAGGLPKGGGRGNVFVGSGGEAEIGTIGLTPLLINTLVILNILILVQQAQMVRL